MSTFPPVEVQNGGDWSVVSPTIVALPWGAGNFGIVRFAGFAGCRE